LQSSMSDKPNVSENVASLAPLLLVGVVLVYVLPSTSPLWLTLSSARVALVFWCLLSSCLGTPILRSAQTIWDYAVLSAQSTNRLTPARRSRYRTGQDELFEMETRSRFA